MTPAVSNGPETLRWPLGTSFIAIGLWALKPDKLDATPSTLGFGNVGVGSTS